MEKLSLTWQAPEYHHYKRSPDWFWAVGIIVVCITILAFVYNNALFGILILLSSAILVFFTLREPDIVEYEINNRGIVIGKDLHPYISIESFWIETRHGQPKIILKSKKSMTPLLAIPLHEESVDEVFNVLNDFLEEKELQEPFSHKIMEYLGF